MRNLTPFLITCLVAAPAFTDATPHATKLRDAQQVLHALMDAPDKGIPKDLLERAACIGVFPGVTKGAVVMGGEFGHGVFTCRQESGAMGPPAFFTLGGPSVGWQFGVEQVDLVLLVMNKEGVQRLLESKFTIGGEASAAAGPVGRTATAATDAQLHAEILSWSRTRGLFVGASLAGKVIKPDPEANQELYGEQISARKILLEGKAPMTKEARSFMQTTNEYARRPS